MTEVELTDTSLIVHVKGADKFFALKSQLEVPLSHITGAEIDPSMIEEWNQLFLWGESAGHRNTWSHQGGHLLYQ